MDRLALNEQTRGPGRPPIPIDRIVRTALTILDEEGAEALTFRAVAKRLSSSTATLYRHVANRAELIGLVLDALLAEPRQITEADDSDDWRDVYRTIAESTFAVLARHSGAASLFAQALPSGPNGMAIRERMLASMLRGGFSPLASVKATATISHYILGFAVQSAGAQDQDDASLSRLDALLTGEDRSHFPATAQVRELLPRPLAEEFAFGLDLILRGLTDSLRGDGATGPAE